jgi:hypothetical protein
LDRAHLGLCRGDGGFLIFGWGDNALLDQKVISPANQQQVLDAIAANQDDAPFVINDLCGDQSQALGSATGGKSASKRAKTAKERASQEDKANYQCQGKGQL